MNERLLRLCLLAYPRSWRARDGEVLLDLATELAAQRGATGEALGLIRGGLVARWQDTASGARAPWGNALGRLALPLAAATASISVVGALRFGTLDLGKFWTALLAGSLIALAGAVVRSRVSTLLGALMVLGTLLLDGVLSGLDHRAARLQAFLGHASVDLLAAWIPAAALLAAAALAPVSVERRPRTLAARTALGALPALTLVLLVPHLPLGTPATSPEMAEIGAEELQVLLLLVSFAALPPLAAIAGALAARRDPAAALAAALVLAAWTPEAIWLGTGHSSLEIGRYLPIEDDSLPLALAVYAGAGLIAGLVVVGLVRRAARQIPPLKN